MKVIKSAEFTAERAWGALDITTMHGVSMPPALDRRAV